MSGLGGAASGSVTLCMVVHTEAIAFDVPVIPLGEPSNHFFETRRIPTDRQIGWEHIIFPTHTAILERGPDSDHAEPSMMVDAAPTAACLRPQSTPPYYY